MSSFAPGQRSVLALRELHLAQYREHRVEDRDVAQAAGLRCATAPSMDVDHAMLKIDVGPHQVQRFVETHASAD